MTTTAADPYALFVAAIRTPATRKMYDWALERYMKFCNVEACGDLLKGDTAEIQNRFQMFVLSLKADHISNSMRNVCFSAVKLFYYINDITLNWKKLSKLKGDNKSYRRDEAYSKDDIEKMLIAAGDDERLKAIVLIFATSGVRLGGLAGLKIRDVRAQEPDNVLALRIYPQTDEQYVTFATPQALRHIRRYLKQRFRTLENLNPDAPLIAHPEYKDHPADENHLGNVIRELAVKAGLRPAHGEQTARHTVMRVHGFRKFFASTIANTTDIPHEHRERLLGHITNLDRSYIKMDIQELLPQYHKAVPALTFQNASQPLG